MKLPSAKYANPEIVLPTTTILNKSDNIAVMCKNIHIHGHKFFTTRPPDVI